RVAPFHEGGGLRGHPHDRPCHRAALAHGLAADIHHARAAGLVDVREAVYAGTAERCAATIRSRTACSSPRRSRSTGSGSPFTIDSKKTLRSWYVGSVALAHPRASFSSTASRAYGSP